MTPITILIAHVSYQAATASFIKMLRQSQKFTCRIIGCDSMPKGYSSGSMLVDVFYHVASKVGSAEYMTQIKQICDTERVNLIISAEEEDLLCFHKGSVQCFLDNAIADPSIFAIFNDKHLANIQIRRQAVNVPNTIMNYNELELSTKELFIYRKRVSSCSRGIKVLGRREIADDYVFFSDEHITQEFLEGDTYTVDVLCDKDGEMHLAIPRRNLAVKDGTTFKCQIVYDERIINACQTIYSTYRIPGISNAQFIINEGEPYFIELNMRASATLIASSLASVNFLDYYISHFLFNESVPSYSALMNTVKWDSIIARYYQETIYTGECNG